MDRSLGSPVLFAIVWVTLASAIYFSLGVVADHALGLTPVVFAVATLFFGLVSNVFTSVFVSRTLFEFILSRRPAGATQLSV